MIPIQHRIRKAEAADIPALQTLIRASVMELQTDYTAEQRQLALQKVFGVDTQLVEDGTYYVAEAADSAHPAGALIAGCGGWSRRPKLFGSDHYPGRADALLDPELDAARIRAFFVHPSFARRGVGSQLLKACEHAAAAAGFRRLAMGATLTGVPLYRAHGYMEGERDQVLLAPGIFLSIVHMEKQL